MQYTKLGNSELKVSRICKGCMGFGDPHNGQQHIQNMIDTSLRNLGMDYVDLYIYHMWDHQTFIYDILDGLSQAVKAGKVRYIGISNCFAYQLAKANALAERRSLP